MTNPTDRSVTTEPCRCHCLQARAGERHWPIIFDPAMNEYRFEYLDPDGEGEQSVASLLIYHCPFCGGRMPESTRDQWFAQVSPEEIDRLSRLFAGLRSATEVIATFGEPTHDNPAGETQRRRLPDGSLGPVTTFRTLLYSQLSDTAEATFAQSADGVTHLSVQGKYLGPPSSLTQGATHKNKPASTRIERPQKTTEQFANAAADFAQWAEQCKDTGELAARNALRHITTLFLAAQDLPNPVADAVLADDEVSQEEWQAIYANSARLPIDYYGEVFNPLPVPAEESCLGSVADDIADIYDDVVSGLRLYRAGRTEDAVYQWTFSFQVHWGEHATGAIRALHACLS